MKYLALIAILIGCGEANKRRWNCTMQGDYCDVRRTENNVEGEDLPGEDNPVRASYGIPGPVGPQGEPGSDGSDGAPGMDGSDGAQGPQGVPGTPGQDGTNGVNGVDGTDGTDGQDGEDGEDGEDGQDGEDGINGTLVSIVDPCGNHPTKVDSVLLVLSSGFVVSANSKGLTWLTPGVYTTSDGTHCTFTVHAGGSVTW